jgi:cell division initiation protein
MRISPLDIRKQPFRKTLRGFDKDAVNSFLEMVATEFEKMIKQNDELATKVKVLQARVDEFEKIEKTLNETLLTAQRATDEARVNAQKEAELIIKDAQIRADKYEDASRRNVSKLESELISLKIQRDSFLARFKSMLRDQLSLVDVICESIEDEKKGGTDSKKGKNPPEDTPGKKEYHEDETMDEVPPQPVV